MQRIPREHAKRYAFDWRDEPLLHVKPGETFEIETYDASTGYFKSPDDLTIPARRPGFARVPPARQSDRRPGVGRGRGARRRVGGHHRADRRGRLLVDCRRPAPRTPRRIRALARALVPVNDEDLPPHPRCEWD